MEKFLFQMYEEPLGRRINIKKKKKQINSIKYNYRHMHFICMNQKRLNTPKIYIYVKWHRIATKTRFKLF